MVMKVHDGQVLGRPTEDLIDFAEAFKVLLDHVLLVEGWRHVPALDGGAVGGTHATQALRALPASLRGCDAGIRGWSWRRVWRGL